MARRDAADHKYRQFLTAERADPVLRTACLSPHIIAAIGLPGFLDRERGNVPVEIEARCRKCEGCLLHRRRLWTARAIDELKASQRSWFGTLTLSPESQWRMRLATDRRIRRRRGELLQQLEPAEQFKETVDTINREITLFLKRVRKQAGVPLRYLLVSEAHASGDPHFHIILHEPSSPVRKSLLEKQWRLGFSHWRLVDTLDSRSAYYACKYLSKDAQTRVRASVRYGQPQLVAALTERLVKVSDAVKNAPGQTQPVSGSPLGGKI